MTKKQTVILLHGLARKATSMNKLEKALKEQGFTAVNVDYPSTKHDIESLAESSIGDAIDKVERGSTINFITH